MYRRRVRTPYRIKTRRMIRRIGPRTMGYYHRYPMYRTRRYGRYGRYRRRGYGYCRSPRSLVISLIITVVFILLTYIIYNLL